MEKLGSFENMLESLKAQLFMVSEPNEKGQPVIEPLGSRAEATQGGDTVRTSEQHPSSQTGGDAESGDDIPERRWQKQLRKDVQGLKVVTFDGTDWLSWRITVELQLGLIGMLTYLTHPRPSAASGATATDRWNCANALLRSYLLDRTSPNVKRTVLTFPTAKATWESLEEQWGGNTVAAHEDLLDEWENFTQSPKDTMRDYIDNLNHLVLKMEHSKVEDHVTDVRKRHKLLRGMDSQWSHLKDIIKLSDMAYPEACKRLLETGKREGDNVEAKAFYSQRGAAGHRRYPSRQPNGPCYCCGELGHLARDCPKGVRNGAGRGGTGQGPSALVGSLVGGVATPSAAK